MAETDDGKSRLDRIEAIIDTGAARQAKIEAEFRRLRHAQMLLAISMRELAESVRGLPRSQ